MMVGVGAYAGEGEEFDVAEGAVWGHALGGGGAG